MWKILPKRILRFTKKSVWSSKVPARTVQQPHLTNDAAETIYLRRHHYNPNRDGRTGTTSRHNNNTTAREQNTATEETQPDENGSLEVNTPLPTTPIQCSTSHGPWLKPQKRIKKTVKLTLKKIKKNEVSFKQSIPFQN